MSVRCDDVYRSSNGDRWQLLTDTATKQRFVRHLPNASSGGTAREIPIDDFLRIDGPGPEFDAIRRALETGQSAAPVRRPVGFFWVQGPERPEPAYWDGQRWSMFSPVTIEPQVLVETPILPEFDNSRNDPLRK